MISTTRSQSARLIACGVDPKTADMCLSTRTRRADGTPIAKKSQTTNLWVGYPCWRTTSGEEELENIPAWSLSALLSLIPHVIEVYDDGDYYFSLAQEFPASEAYADLIDKVSGMGSWHNNPFVFAYDFELVK